jgi:hypothetical protein
MIDGQKLICVGTKDRVAIAFNKDTGEVIWKTRREDILPQPYHWYTFTGAPQVYDGLVVVGNGGAEWPTRGFVEALDAETGKLVWRFNLTAGPDDPNFKGAWEGDSWKIGGGSMWDADLSPDAAQTLAHTISLRRICQQGIGHASPYAALVAGPKPSTNTLRPRSPAASFCSTISSMMSSMNRVTDQWG